MSLTDKIINPETGRTVTVGGIAYKNLVKRGVIQPKEVHVVDNKKKIKIDVEPATKTVSREEKRAYLKHKKAKENKKYESSSAKRIRELEEQLALLQVSSSDSGSESESH